MWFCSIKYIMRTIIKPEISPILHLTNAWCMHIYGEIYFQRFWNMFYLIFKSNFSNLNVWYILFISIMYYIISIYIHEGIKF